MQLAIADAQRLAEVFRPAVRMPAEPMGGRAHHVISRSGLCQSAEQGRLHRRLALSKGAFASNARKRGAGRSFPNSIERHGLVQQLRSRQAEKRGSLAGMEARANDCRSGGEAGEEGLCPRADDHWRVVVDENDVDACIWENAMRVNPLGAEDRLRPEAEDAAGERRGRTELAVVGNFVGCMDVSIHHSNLSRQDAFD